MNTYSRLFAILLAFLAAYTCSAQIDSVDAGARGLPLKISFRKSTLNDSLVARFTNTSSDVFLTAVATFKNGTYNEVKQKKLNVGPGKTAEVGWAQGWRFMTGETITVQSQGYAPLTATVP
jgi:hypothetical protein